MTNSTRQTTPVSRNGRRKRPDSGNHAEWQDGNGFTVEESETVAAEVQRARMLDRGVARFLDQRHSATPPASSSAIHALGERARLPAAIERRLLEAAIAGDRRARAALVEAFLPLIAGVAATYRSSSRVTRTELMQEGVVGLLRALERFDPTLGTPFWAYAAWWVRQAMQQLVAELTRPVVMSDRALRQLSKIKDAAASLQRDGHSPSLSQLSDRTGLEERQLANLITADRPPKALEEPIPGEEGQVGTFGELIADPLAQDEYERVITNIAIGQLRDLLSGLSDRERSILQARFGLDGESASLGELAGRLGVSAERVRQLENRALGKLRAAAGPLDESDGFAKEV